MCVIYYQSIKYISRDVWGKNSRVTQQHFKVKLVYSSRKHLFAETREASSGHERNVTTLKRWKGVKLSLPSPVKRNLTTHHTAHICHFLHFARAGYVITLLCFVVTAPKWSHIPRITRQPKTGRTSSDWLIIISSHCVTRWSLNTYH